MKLNLSLYIFATRAVTVNSTGEQSVQRVERYIWKTPTEVTKKILQQKTEFLRLYKEYVLSLHKECTVPVYEHGNEFTGKQIGTEVLNLSKNECESLGEWLEYVQQHGYVVDFCTHWEEVTV